MKLYLPNGGILIVSGNTTIESKGDTYRVKLNSDNSLLLDIVNGIVIVYNDYPHTYIPPKVPLSTKEIFDVIEADKLNPQVLRSLKNKLSKYQVKSNTWKT